MPDCCLSFLPAVLSCLQLCLRTRHCLHLRSIHIHLTFYTSTLHTYLTDTQPYLTIPDKIMSNVDRLLNNFFTDPQNQQTKLDLSSADLSHLPSLLPTLIASHPHAAARIALINLAHNNLSTLPQCLSQLPNLRVLFLLNNRFSTIPSVIPTINSLSMLSFKENKLTTINANLLPPNLRWLILTSNQITTLSPDFPSRCRNVRKLMLSNNLLTHLPSLEPMQHLELIRLANNRFAKIPEQVFQLPRLRWLALAGNPAIPTPSTPGLLPAKLRVNLEQRYTVHWQQPLGSGTSGTTYPATDNDTGHKVAVKKFHNLAGSDGRALDELFISLSITCIPHLVSSIAYDYQSIDGIITQLYLVMNLIPDNPQPIASPPSLATCTTSVYHNPLSITFQQAGHIANAVQSASRALRQAGVCHGDIYAHNVLLSQNDNALQVTLSDLGAAWTFPPHLEKAVSIVEERAIDVFRQELLAFAT